MGGMKEREKELEGGKGEEEWLHIFLRNTDLFCRTRAVVWS